MDEEQDVVRGQGLEKPRPPRGLWSPTRKNFRGSRLCHQWLGTSISPRVWCSTGMFTRHDPYVTCGPASFPNRDAPASPGHGHHAVSSK